MTDVETTKTIVEITTPLVVAYLDGYVKPVIIQKATERRKKSVNTDFLAHYYAHTIEKFYYMRTIALGDSSHALTDLYIPLSINRFQASGETYRIDGFPLELVTKYKRVIIKDTAGMGKSTLTKYIFLQSIKQKNHIPIYVELRRIRDDEPLINFIIDDLGGDDLGVNKASFNDIYKTGQLLIILDGYDEIRSQLKERVTQEINDFCSRFKNAKIILTSRDDSSLPSFAGFASFSVEKLTYEDACDLLTRYGESAKKTIHNAIIDQINRMRDENFISLLENPLIISLLFRAYDYKNKIPISKSAFYGQVYDALFEGHDLSKDGYERERKTGLDKFAFEDILKIISYKSIKRGPSYDDQMLKDMITGAIKSEVHLNFTVSDYIKDVTWAIPLMIEEGNEIRWTHKSFQEYFTARYICSSDASRKERVVNTMFNGVRSLDYSNVIEMCLSLDRSLVLKSAILPYIEAFYKHYIETKQSHPWLNEDELKYRSALTYKSAYNFFTDFTRTDLNERKTIVESMSGEGDRINASSIIFHSSNDKNRVVVECVYVCDRRHWIAEVLERNEIFKGVAGLVYRKAYEKFNFSQGAKFDVYIPRQSTSDADFDSKYHNQVNSMMYAIHNHIGGGKGHFIDPEKCPEIVAAIKMSLDIYISEDEDDFS